MIWATGTKTATDAADNGSENYEEDDETYNLVLSSTRPRSGIRTRTNISAPQRADAMATLFALP